MLLENIIKVYIRVDENNYVTSINSSIFLDNVENYICIDEGSGDKYAHAQGNYLSKSLMDEQGRYNYKYINNKLVELSEDDKPVIEQDIPVKTEDEGLMEYLVNLDYRLCEMEIKEK